MKCRICREREADSKEHVFPSALGARWAVPDVLCGICNAACGRGIDAALVRTFQDLRLQLGIEGDRGQVATAAKVDNHGTRIIVSPGMVPRAADGEPVIITDDGVNKTFSVANERAARKFLASQERKGQKITVRDVAVNSTYPGWVPMNVAFQGEDAFRSCTKSVLTFIESTGGTGMPDAFRDAWAYVGGGARDGSGVAIALSASPSPVSSEQAGLGPVSHRIVARASPGPAHVEADLRFFGDYGLCVRILPRTPLACINIGYGIDPLSGESRRFDDWTGAVGIPGAADSELVMRALRDAVAATSRFATERNDERLRKELIETAVREVCVDVPEGAAIPPEVWQRAFALIAERYTRHLLRLESSAPAPDLLRRLTENPDQKR